MFKKISIISIVIILLVIAGGYGMTKARALSSGFYVNTSASASTTVSFLNPASTATTTYQLAQTTPGYNASVDANFLFIQFNASSSASSLSWKVQYSNGSSCYSNENGCDWYEADNSSVSGGNIVHSTSTNVWAPGVSGISRKAIQVPDVAATYKRIVFYITPATANGSLYVQDTARINQVGQ